MGDADRPPGTVHIWRTCVAHAPVINTHDLLRDVLQRAHANSPFLCIQAGLRFPAGLREGCGGEQPVPSCTDPELRRVEFRVLRPPPPFFWASKQSPHPTKSGSTLTGRQPWLIGVISLQTETFRLVLSSVICYFRPWHRKVTICCSVVMCLSGMGQSWESPRHPFHPED